MKKEGITIFSYPFHEEWTFDSQLFSGFLTAFNTFSCEIFAASLDRANFGEHTILMHPLPPFALCYVIKGNSYIAQKRILSFIQEIQNDETNWIPSFR